MGGTRTNVRAGMIGLAVVTLLGIAGCGDDDDGTSPLGAPDAGGEDDTAGAGGDAADASGASGAPDGPGAALGVCDLLEVAEIEAQFGDLGTVAEGETTMSGCRWQVGEQLEGAVVPPALNVQVIYDPDEDLQSFFPEGSAEPVLTEIRSRDDVVDVPGLADEAVLEFGILYVRSGETLVSVEAYTIVGADDFQAKLVPLAEQLVSRL